MRPYTTIKGSTVYGDYTIVKVDTPAPEKMQEVNILYAYNNLSVSGHKQPGVYLDWGSFYANYEYELQRSTDGKNFATILIGKDIYCYEDLTAQVGKAYYYRVRLRTMLNGVDTYGKYANSKAVKVQITAPYNLAATTLGTDSVKLTWGATGYEIRRLPVGSLPYVTYDEMKVVKDIPATTSFTDKGLKKNTKYAYCVRAFKMVGTYKNILGASMVMYVTTKAPDLTAGKGLKATSVSGGAKASWSVVTNATGYQLERSTDKKKYATIYTGTKTTYTDKKAQVGKTYYLRVRPFKGTGKGREYGDYSKVVTLKVATVKSLSAGKGLKVTVRVQTQVSHGLKLPAPRVTSFSVLPIKRLTQPFIPEPIPSSLIKMSEERPITIVCGRIR